LTETLLKDTGLKVNDENTKAEKMRKTILKFIAVTHPDKHGGKERHIQLLFEEITKMLNEIYERFKSVS
jgi:hypothetical protein